MVRGDQLVASESCWQSCDVREDSMQSELSERVGFFFITSGRHNPKPQSFLQWKWITSSLFRGETHEMSSSGCYYAKYDSKSCGELSYVDFSLIAASLKVLVCSRSPTCPLVKLGKIFE